MSPVARRRSGAHTGWAVLVAFVGVAAALGIAYGVAALASNSDVEVNLGDERFDAGSTESLSSAIREDGEPILFPDPANFSRAIYIDHSGDDPDTGWTAFSAFLPDRPDCTVLFDRGADAFSTTEDCEEQATFPRSGAGLRQFPTDVVDGNLFVDLQRTGSPPS